MKKFLTFAAVLMLAACSSDEIFVDEAPNASSKGQVPIAVNTYLQGQTRTVGYTYYDELPGKSNIETALTSTGFLLLAQYQTPGETPDAQPQETELLNQKIIYNDGWILKVADDFVYWPKNQDGSFPKVTFGAITSFVVDVDNENNSIKLEDRYSPKVLPSDGKITIPTEEKFDKEKNHQYYPDIVAAHIEADPNTKDGTVELGFKHILSQVSYLAEFPKGGKSESFKWSYKIKSITLTGKVTNEYDVLSGKWKEYNQDTDRPISYTLKFEGSSQAVITLLKMAANDNKPIEFGNGEFDVFFAIPGQYDMTLEYDIRHNEFGNDYDYEEKRDLPYDSYTVSTTTPITFEAGKKNVVNIKLPDTDKMDMGISVGLSDWVDGGNQEPVF